MNFTLLVIVQWLHILAGTIWVGTQIFIAIVLWPALLRRPAGEARVFVQGVGRYAGKLMGVSGLVVLVLGIVRGTVFGPIRSLQALVGTSYGLTFLASLVIMVLLAAYGSATRRNLASHVWAGDSYHPHAASYLRRFSAINLAGLGAILLCMVLMGFGR